MLDDVQIERKELSRLLATAKDEDRKDMIRRAMQALDSHEEGFGGSEKFNPHSVSPSLHASIYSSSNLAIIEGPSKAMRPASARRRPSVPNLLDSIPEVITTSRNHGGRDEEEIVLPYEDIAEAIPSSFDSRFPVKSIFKANTTNSSSSISHTASPLSLSHAHLMHQPSMKNGFPRSRGSSWMSTGLVPQFIVITFYEKWTIRKVEVKTILVERLAVHVNYSASTAFSSTRLVEMKSDIDGKFTVDLLNGNNNGVAGIGVTLFILQSAGSFCGISQVKIMVTPNH